jgi:hypothetical protein
MVQQKSKVHATNMIKGTIGGVHKKKEWTWLEAQEMEIIIIKSAKERKNWDQEHKERW